MKQTNSMCTMLVMSFSLVLMVSSLALSANKVVIIPLGGSSTVAYPCTGPDEVMSQGQCWKDKNLGATQVAKSPTDVLAYGDLYQWGRLGDGHQNRSSSITALNSSNDVPGHSDFISRSASPFSYRVPQNPHLWQGLGGVNNPCPQGFRIPTITELKTELDSWTDQNAAGAYASPLKLVMAGWRNSSGTEIYNSGNYGFYWSSTVSEDIVRIFQIVFTSSLAEVINNSAVTGRSVRCIKN